MIDTPLTKPISPTMPTSLPQKKRRPSEVREVLIRNLCIFFQGRADTSFLLVEKEDQQLVGQDGTPEDNNEEGELSELFGLSIQDDEDETACSEQHQDQHSLSSNLSLPMTDHEPHEDEEELSLYEDYYYQNMADVNALTNSQLSSDAYVVDPEDWFDVSRAYEEPLGSDDLAEDEDPTISDREVEDQDHEEDADSSDDSLSSCTSASTRDTAFESISRIQTRRSVRFHPTKLVVDIPSFRDYPEHIRGQIWMSLEEVDRTVERNRYEYLSEGWNPRCVLEEDSFMVDQNGELIHPETWLIRLYQDQQEMSLEKEAIFGPGFSEDAGNFQSHNTAGGFNNDPYGKDQLEAWEPQQQKLANFNEYHCRSNEHSHQSCPHHRSHHRCYHQSESSFEGNSPRSQHKSSEHRHERHQRSLTMNYVKQPETHEQRRQLTRSQRRDTSKRRHSSSRSSQGSRRNHTSTKADRLKEWNGRQACSNGGRSLTRFADT